MIQLKKCKFRYFYNNINSTLIIIPIFTITSRIYSIYNNKSKVTLGKKLKNKRLMIYIFYFLYSWLSFH